jgi:hypothetical protein
LGEPQKLPVVKVLVATAAARWHSHVTPHGPTLGDHDILVARLALDPDVLAVEQVARKRRGVDELRDWLEGLGVVALLAALRPAGRFAGHLAD